jgi:cell wall-associated NlpC family hydrolase
MYQKFLIFVLVVCCYGLPVNANEPSEDSEITSQDLSTVATEAKSWQGTRYRYAGKDRNGIDCSHFVFAVYNRIFEGYDYRMVMDYLRDPEFSTTKHPLPGDVIIFLPMRGGVSEHIGIITDARKSKFIGAQSSTGVKEASFAPGSYWGKRPYKILSLLPSNEPSFTFRK